ncbi:MAG: hypothetical protein NC926_08335 [Candidatus Omnitrophica bacterium]|nr:hypothetical protein [Candidatus Omnitrophota bacterium]
MLEKNKGIYTKEEVEKLLKKLRKNIKIEENKGIYTKEEVEKLLKKGEKK